MERARMNGSLSLAVCQRVVDEKWALAGVEGWWKMYTPESGQGSLAVQITPV